MYKIQIKTSNTMWRSAMQSVLFGIVLLLCFLLQSCATGQVAFTEKISFSVYAASQTPRAQWQKKQKGQTKETIYVDTKAILTEQDVRVATAKQDALLRPMVILELTPIGQLKLQAATKQLNTKQLAVVVNQEVISVIDATQTSTGKNVALLQLSSDAVAQYLQKQLTKK